MDASTLASTKDARLLGAVQKVDSIAALRARAVPTPLESGTAVVSGYYAPGDTEAVEYVWNAAATTPDDGGASIQPTGDTGPGRWLLAWDHNRANVRHWGARLTDAYAPTFDSLAAINAAINALPAADYNPIFPPGAGSGGHIRKGIVYFPGGGQNQAYAVTGTVYGSADLRFEGDDYDQSCLSLWPGTATNMSLPPTYVVKVCYSLQNTVAEGNPNETFFSEIKHLSILSGSGNPNSIPLYYVGCNGNGIDHVRVEGALQDAVICANSLAIDHLTSGAATSQTGVTVQGSYGLTCHNWDIEHSNMVGNTPVGSVPTATSHLDPGTGMPYPAIRVTGCSGCAWDTISTESSAISFELIGSSYITAMLIHGNPNCDGLNLVNVPGAADVNIHGAAEGIAIAGIYNGPTGGVPNVIDTSTGVWPETGGGHTRNLTFTGTAARTSYYQDTHFQHASADHFSASVASIATLVSGGIYASTNHTQDGSVYLGSTEGDYGAVLHGYYHGDRAGSDGRYRFQFQNLWNGNSASYGTITKDGWGILKDSPTAALDVNGSAQVSGAVSCGTLNVRSLPTSATGLASGDIYRSGTTLMVVP